MNNNFLESLEPIVPLLKVEGKILITAHINPDGDAVGSGLALTLALKGLHKKLGLNSQIDFILPEAPPKSTFFLEDSELIKAFDENLSEVNYDFVITVDAPTLERIGSLGEAFTNAKKRIVIDHHISNTAFGDYNYLGSEGSTSEIIFDLIELLGGEFTPAISNALYLGIVNDTGNFAHSNVTPKTFEKAKRLIESGANNSNIIKNFWEGKQLNTLKLMGFALNKMEFIPEKKLSYLYLSKDDLDKFSATKEDTEGFVNLINSHFDSEVALFLREDSRGLIKGSLRSKANINVNLIAKKFGGGGHIRASGFSCQNKGFYDIVEQVKSFL